MLPYLLLLPVLKSNIFFFLFVTRNYHVFYYLLAGASEEERSAFHLKQPEEYHYLNQVGTLCRDTMRSLPFAAADS